MLFRSPPGSRRRRAGWRGACAASAPSPGRGGTSPASRRGRARGEPARWRRAPAGRNSPPAGRPAGTRTAAAPPVRHHPVNTLGHRRPAQARPAGPAACAVPPRLTRPRAACGARGVPLFLSCHGLVPAGSSGVRRSWAHVACSSRGSPVMAGARDGGRQETGRGNNRRSARSCSVADCSNKPSSPVSF